MCPWRDLKGGHRLMEATALPKEGLCPRIHTDLLCKVKYHCTVDLMLGWFRFSNQLIHLFGWILTSKTRYQLYNDTSTYKVSEYSLVTLSWYEATEVELITRVAINHQQSNGMRCRNSIHKKTKLNTRWTTERKKRSNKAAKCTKAGIEHTQSFCKQNERKTQYLCSREKKQDQKESLAFSGLFWHGVCAWTCTATEEMSGGHTNIWINNEYNKQRENIV